MKIRKEVKSRVKKNIATVAVMLFLAVPFLSGCESKKLKQENESLKKQVETLTGEKTTSESHVKDLTAKLAKAEDDLKAKSDELAKTEEMLKAKKAPAKKK